MANSSTSSHSFFAAGNDIDYQGATDVEFNVFGDAAGAFKELEVSGGGFVTLGAL